VAFNDCRALKFTARFTRLYPYAASRQTPTRPFAWLLQSNADNKAACGTVFGQGDVITRLNDCVARLAM
jgi:hypothetical protein